MFYNNTVFVLQSKLLTSGDDKPTKPAKENVKDELTSTDEDKMALTEEMLQLKNNKEYLGRLKNNHTYVFYSDITLVLISFK